MEEEEKEKENQTKKQMQIENYYKANMCTWNRKISKRQRLKHIQLSASRAGMCRSAIHYRVGERGLLECIQLSARWRSLVADPSL